MRAFGQAGAGIYKEKNVIQFLNLQRTTELSKNNKQNRYLFIFAY